MDSLSVFCWASACRQLDTLRMFVASNRPGCTRVGRVGRTRAGAPLRIQVKQKDQVGATAGGVARRRQASPMRDLQRLCLVLCVSQSQSPDEAGTQ